MHDQGACAALADELGRLRAERARAAARAAERLAQNAAAHAPLPGRPAQPGMSAHEVMMAGEKDGAFSAWERQLEDKRHSVGYTFGPDGIPYEGD